MSGNAKEVDFLIIGQGLAGSLLAWILRSQGVSVHIVDNSHKGSSSIVAAGIINPITGRRLVKSWMVDELLPVAREVYREIEKALSCSVYQERIIYRALKDIKSENQWDERSAANDYSPYMGSEVPEKTVQEFLEKPFSWGAIHHAAQVDISGLLNRLKNDFKSKGQLTEEDFGYDQLKTLKTGGVEYNNINAKHIIFCEGHRGRFNPWFGHLPFVVSKGEMLEIKLDNPSSFPIIKHQTYLAPLPNNKLWVGATYEWDDLREDVTEKAREQLEKKLKRSLSKPYKIVNQHAAIRPTVKDRRPFLGTHTDFPCLHIFNGLGTKGTSLGPYWGRHFARYLLAKQELDTRVDIRRFE